MTGPESMDEVLAEFKKRLAERKAAERGDDVGMPVPWWQPEPPLHYWDGCGPLVAVNAAPMGGLTGYVHLPEKPPWRELDLQGDDCEIVEVHGGITFGPHITGWIGFDSYHAFDVWDETSTTLVDGRVLAWKEQPDYLVSLPATDSDTHWTWERMVAELAYVAEQVKRAAS